MAVERRQLLLGGAASVVLMLAVWSQWPATPAPPAPAAQAVAPARARGPAGLAPTAPVKLAALTASREGPGEGARNPFRYQPRVVAPPPRAVVAPSAPVIDAPRPPPPPSGPPPVPPIPLKLIGVVERASGVKWAVLTDGKSGPMYGKDGDIIDGRYTIVKIGTESIEMTYADGRGRQVIRLTGQ